MTAIQFLLIIVSILFILMGILILTRSITSKQSIGHAALPEGVQQKDGLPILPREQRQFVEYDEIDEPELVEQEASDVVNDFTNQEVSEPADMSASTQAFKNAANTTIIDNAKTSAATTLTSGVLASNSGERDDLKSVAEEQVVASVASIDTDSGKANQNSPLLNAQETLSIHLLPNNEFSSIKGVDVLKQVEHYGFKFGEMNMFHRYQEKDGTGMLWFSMMGLTLEGIVAFDLHTIPDCEYKGLALFLSLPHPKVFQGFDSMMSIATLMARELDAQIVDDSGKVITPNYKKVMRAQLEQNYQ